MSFNLKVLHEELYHGCAANILNHSFPESKILVYMQALAAKAGGPGFDSR